MLVALLVATDIVVISVEMSVEVAWMGPYGSLYLWGPKMRDPLNPVL